MAGGIDHGELNIPLAKRYGKGGIDAAIDKHLAEQRRRSAAEHRARLKAAREAEADRPKVTAADIKGARYVRDQFGWHRVIRISEKSVTVETPYSWTERIALTKVLEARA